MARPRTNCPRCRDRGSIAFFNKAFRRGLPSDVSGVVRHGISSFASREEFFGPLERLLGRDGQDVSPVLGHPKSEQGIWCGDARFVRDGGHDRILVLLQPRGWPVPGESPVRLILLDLDGRLLDWMAFSCGTREGFLCGDFSTSPGSRGDVARIERFSASASPVARLEIGLENGRLVDLDPDQSASIRIR